MKKVKARSTIAVVGAGITGLWQAIRLAEAGYQVTVFDKGSGDFTNSCSYYAGGMLAPFCESESAEPLISQMGQSALKKWKDLIARLPEPVFFQDNGTLVLAHRQDLSELEDFTQRLKRAGYGDYLTELSDVSEQEPSLSERFSRGLYIRQEACLNPREILPALQQYAAAKGVEFCWNKPINNPVSLKGDWILDCRGMGASQPDLRGVKGEMLVIHSTEIHLQRPIRLLHPRHPIYIVPRGEGIFMIGATMIESETRGRVTVQSALELLSTVYTLHPAFGEAEIIEFATDLRPAYPNHLPRIRIKDRVISINGLYRHGYLLAPALADCVVQWLEDETIEGGYDPVFK